MVAKNKYMIWCNQRHQYFGDNAEFESLVGIREQLISYHEVDNEEDLSGWKLSDYLESFGWEVHDLKGNIILIEEDEFTEMVREKIEKIKDGK